ncbi:penicillin acylase family protein [Rossellomorea aquimaris]|uniref:Penicillin acylase family protein n=1 Tax=Rossellomorea aquimaris TaxID=189382 RepID=A0A5D4TVA0_9BACI|nr:penicillin acylase family protein [Rossellomorea aquimaris]TYS79165.1 penicillin acylase family protein [Rossellomorea aquimaris]TYS84913.1 penicillin acylase family protein [Rossellomorea aquimaris]
MELLREKKNKRLKITLCTAGSILFIMLGILIFANYYIDRSLPVTSGTISLNGLSQDVEVIRDKDGVPHILAQNEKDLYMAQGYVQAQDRLFQMDLSRRQASGRLSEVVGEKAIDRDKFFRTFGLRRAAEVSFTAYPDEAKQLLEWYAVGVNAYMQEATDEGRLPIEFTLLGYKPEKWTPIDSLTIGKYMAFDLGGHWQGQAFRYWALENLPKDKAYDLSPSYPEDAPAILSDIGEVQVDMEQSFAGAVIPPEFNGSNNWVVSGEKTASGKPLLADDPHLSLGTPSIWYQMHLESPQVNVSGVIFAGIPGIILGHNEQIAWGVTNTGPDVQDLYVEKQNEEDPSLFLYDEKWERATVIEEPIKVKDGDTIPYEVTITRHGPVISEFAHQNESGKVLSMRWTALDPSLELLAILNINKAKDWDEFEEALKDFHVPTQNFVFASEDGTIAYKANGKIPIRKKGDGLLPVPGWDPDYEWEGFIPFEELPKVINPESGFIATANNKVVTDEYPYHISHHWAQPYRYMRISEYLEAEKDLSLSDMKDLQMDQVNLHAREMVPILIEDMESGSLTAKEKEAVELLKSWNNKDDKKQAAPLVFHQWMNEISTGLFKKDIPKDMMKLFEGRQSVVDELIRKAHNGEESQWFVDRGGYQTFLTASLTQALDELEEAYGSSMDEWEWGLYHRVYFEHPLSGASSVLKWFLNDRDPEPVGGSRVTVGAASYNESGIVNHGASWRFVIDTENMNNGYHIVGPGQAGHYKSKWYQNQMDAWKNGDYHQTSISNRDGDKLILKAN